MELREPNRRIPRRFYGCSRFPACRVTHGAHPDGSPLGRPADRATRQARQEAHQAFDALWRDADRLYELRCSGPALEKERRKLRDIARRRAYRWLAEQFGAEEVHLGALDADSCARVIDLCLWVSDADLRAWAQRRKAARKGGGSLDR